MDLQFLADHLGSVQPQLQPQLLEAQVGVMLLQAFDSALVPFEVDFGNGLGSASPSSAMVASVSAEDVGRVQKSVRQFAFQMVMEKRAPENMMVTSCGLRTLIPSRGNR